MLLREKYESACNGYVEALLESWDVDKRAGGWIGSVGEVWDNGYITLGMEDIVYCVDHDVKLVQYDDFLGYLSDVTELGLDVPEFKDFCEKRKVIDRDSLDRLLGMKYELETMIDRERRKF